MSTAVQTQVFKAGSTTYFNSSLFFPPAMRAEVFALYGFVRVADNLVDAVPQDAEGFALRGALPRGAGRHAGGGSDHRRFRGAGAAAGVRSGVDGRVPGLDGGRPDEADLPHGRGERWSTSTVRRK
jgi:hypothetical protein